MPLVANVVLSSFWENIWGIFWYLVRQKSKVNCELFCIVERRLKTLDKFKNICKIRTLITNAAFLIETIVNRERSGCLIYMEMKRKLVRRPCRMMCGGGSHQLYQGLLWAETHASRISIQVRRSLPWQAFRSRVQDTEPLWGESFQSPPAAKHPS